MSVIVSGIEYAYSALKTVISDSYGGVHTVANDGLDWGLKAESGGLAPLTGMISSISYPIMAIVGGLAFYLVYEGSQTSRQALPYMPAIIESGAKIAPLLGKIPI